MKKRREELMKKLALSLMMMVALAGAAFAQSVVKVRVNRTAVVTKDKLKLKIVSIDDSRCPKGVQCVTAGNASVKVLITSRIGSSMDVDLNTTKGSKSVKFEGYEFTLVDVTPHPASNVRINGNMRTAKIRIKRNTSMY